MQTLKTNTITEAIAKRRAIEKAMRFFYNNEGEYFVELEIGYFAKGEITNKTTEKIKARREVISHFLGVECLQYWRLEGAESLRLQIDEYKELWDLLKANPPKEEKRTLWGF